MADITKCTNEDCPIKEDCFRWIAKPKEHRQSFQKFSFKIDKNKKANCDNHLIVHNSTKES